MIPKKVFFTKGVGRHKEKLASFELALRDAGIAKLNLVSVSSIFPPGCEVIPRKVGLEKIRAGEVIFLVMARVETDEPNRLIVTSIGCALPNDKTKHGYLSEHHCYGMTEEKAGDYAEDLAASMLASTLGIEFNSDSSWDEKEQLFKMSGEIVKTTNITQSAVGDKNGLWTTVIAAAVFLSEEHFPEEKPEKNSSAQNQSHPVQKVEEPASKQATPPEQAQK